MAHFVFVFGTLKEGFPNFDKNAGKRLPGSFATAERLPLYLVGERHSAWLVDRPGEGHFVQGQIFEVDTAALRTMDVLERIDEPDGYRRRTLRVQSVGPSTPGTLPGTLEVFAYLKEPGQLLGAAVRLGPLAEYTLEHAALYRARIET